MVRRFITLSLIIHSLLFLIDACPQKVKLTENLTIGAEKTGEKEYLLNYPRWVCADGKGNIYIAEGTELTIRMFDKNGKFVKRIGRRGKGPGEFTDLTLVYINNQDELLTFDHFNRRISFFDNAGNLTQEEKYSYDIMGWPRRAQQLPDGNYLLGYKLSNENYILHVCDKNMKKIKSIISRESFGKPIDEINRICDEAWWELSNIFALTKEGNILYSRRYYDGNILIFQKVKPPMHDSIWAPVKRMKGYVEEAAYELYPKNSNLVNEKGERIFEIEGSYGGVKVIGKANNFSLGIF